MSFRTTLMVRALAILMMSIACSAIFGHNTSLVNWHGTGSMAYPTATCFLISSLSLLLITKQNEDK